MREETKTVWRSIAALVFLGTLGAVLARPVFQSGSTEPTSQEVLPSPSPERQRSPKPKKTPPPSPTPTPTPTEEEPSSVELAGSYPKKCLKRAPQTGGSLIALGWDGQVRVGTTSSIIDTFAGQTPVSWSPSGRYLGFGPGNLYVDGEVDEAALFGGEALQWTWSPIADCVAGLTADGDLLVGHPGRTRTLIRGATSVLFSPDGRYLKIGLDEAGTEVINLRKNAIKKGGKKVRFTTGQCADLTDYITPTCSPDGLYVVALQTDGNEGNLGEMWLLTTAGERVREIGEGPYEDTFPEWGPRGTGVLFLRWPDETER
ncbi:MAG TPA: hypothetical protein VNP73_07020, partial [Actinomycetota bacterium]|nr:hypothetical protein [Actinomycetota bacterium]